MRSLYSLIAFSSTNLYPLDRKMLSPIRKQARNGIPSPVEFERQHKTQDESVWKTRGDSALEMGAAE